MEDLLTRWLDVAGPGAASERAGRDLLRRWAEPHRRYHDARHLRAVLAAVDELAADAADARAVRLAAWFHDAVYEGRPGADERASATLAADVLARLGIDAARVDEVVRLVELTEEHRPEVADANGSVLCDADLSILGSDPDSYAGYAAGIRAEYAHVPDEEFRLGRANVLRGLLATDPLFRTPHARRRWEAPARRNLTAELALLSAA